MKSARGNVNNCVVFLTEAIVIAVSVDASLAPIGILSLLWEASNLFLVLPGGLFVVSGTGRRGSVHFTSPIPPPIHCLFLWDCLHSWSANREGLDRLVGQAFASDPIDRPILLTHSV